jgi:branched-chain amino acid transport system substrate-binding protein
MKGYSGVYMLMAAIERVGKLDRKAVAQTLHGIKVNTDRYPGALMYTEIDGNGDVNRMSFMVEVKNGRQEVVDLLPPLNLATKAIPLNAAIPVSATVSKAPAKK